MIIKGKLVMLRPIKISDATRFVKWFNDPDFNKFMARRAMSMREELKWIRGLSKKKDSIHFAIDTSDGVHIGSCGIHDIHKRDRHAFFGIGIGDKRFWGKGYGTEAIRLALRYAFRKLKLRRISLWVYAYNPRAFRAYQKVGFKETGILKKKTFWNGKFYDDFLMSITAKEFKA